MGTKKFLIDGRFLENPGTGVDRYAFETIKELDKVSGDLNISILVPENVKDKPQNSVLENFKNIKVIYSKCTKMWTQVVFASNCILRGRIPVNLCNEVSVLAPKGIVCLHDTCYADYPHFFPDEEVEWFRNIYKRIATHAKFVLTVSNFSKNAIEEHLQIPKDRIVVAGNGWQHFEKVSMDESIFEKYPNIQKKEYFFTLSSANKNKNINWVIEASKVNPTKQFVIAGRNIDKVVDFSQYDNVLYVGAVSDENVKALMHNCKAFIFPSYYEGFGIPPLEALSTGAKIIISNTASLPEIFGKSAYYIEPDNSKVHFESLLNTEVAPAKEVLDKYSWEKTAGILLNVMMKF